MSEIPCPFCDILETRSREIYAETAHFFCFTPLWPLNAGHTLIVPKRHVLYLENLSKKEFADLQKSMNEALHVLKSRGLLIRDYNIGINRGQSAGQTVFHLHVHLIPRLTGDVPDPRGGIIRNLYQHFQTTERPPWLPEFPP